MEKDAVYSPFGWSVGRSGQTRAQVRDEVRSVVERATSRWAAVFPEREGYRIRASSPAGSSNGVRLMVERGNFRASVCVESIRDPSRHAREHQAVRMYGRAEARALVCAAAASHRSIARLRQAGVGVSTLAFIPFLWLIAGAQSTAYILAGMLCMVAGIAITTLGAGLGGYLGECVAAGARRRAIAETSVDTQLQEDLRRWRALSRELSSTRQALTGASMAGPFRALTPEGPATRRPQSRSHPRLATTSFSFSSS
ncbi:MAG: hypothetical protein KUG77_17290 [Nannocystaceae bacterium]|nr:hypothetical protein [Nannocystaceae bacterium]